MKNLLMITLVLSSLPALTQGINIPRPSSKASVSQTIGVATIKVNYGRPGVRGRKVFGELVPLGKVWRAGANEATTITFDYDASFNGNKVPAGTYGLFMIPGKEKWTVILNKVWDQWGAYHYDVREDAVRFEVVPQSISMTGLCTFSFTDVTKSSGFLNMDWENTRIAMVLETNTDEQTLAEIEKATETSRNYWYTYSAAAQYHFYEKKNAEKALEYINIAIALDAPNPAPWMLKSQILASQEKYELAIEEAENALEVSKKLNFWFEIEENEEKIEKWKKKLSR